MRRVMIAGVLAAVCALAAGCSSASTAGSIPPGATSVAPTAAAAQWHLGGAWTGPFPPFAVPLPGPVKTVQLPKWTSTEPLQPGYVYTGSVPFGVPLHYQIPSAVLDCNIASDGPQDQPPGTYVVPFAVTLVNRLAQQAPGPLPQIWATLPDGSQLQATGQSGSQMAWRDVGCSGVTLGADSSDTAYGAIGPATPSQLQQATVYVAWGASTDSSAAVIHQALPLLVPNRALPGN
jgi:hypothetical protein